MTSINLSSQLKVTNSNVVKNSAEDIGAFKNKSKIKPLSKDEQTSILSKYVSDFDESFNEVPCDDSGKYYYFEKENKEDGTKEFLRVVNDNGETKVIHTTVKNGTNKGETELFGISQADEFNAWTTNPDTDVNGNVEDFSMFNFNASTYSKDLKDFAQKYIDKFDKDGDGELNQDEFTALSGFNPEELKTNYENLSKLISMYQEMFVSEHDKDKDGVLNKNEFFELNNIDTSKLTEEEKEYWNNIYESYNINSPNEDDNTISAREIMFVDSVTNSPIKDDINLLNTEYDIYKLIESNFNNLNIDGKKDKTSISAEELATLFFASDIDWDAYVKDVLKGVAPFIDGKINFDNYNCIPMTENGLTQMKEFYDNFYAK